MFRREMTVTAAVENMEAVTAFVDECLEALGCPPRAQIQIDVAVDELFSNIAHYAYAPGTGEATVRVESVEAPAAVAVTFIDQGVPYNPLEHADPDITLSAEERQIGGLGILMVKKSMDEVSYAFRDGRNQLRILKRL